MSKISTGELVCRLYNADERNLQDLLDRNDAIYLEFDETHRWVFVDGSFLTIDEDGEPSWASMNIQPQLAQVAQPTQSEPWYKRLVKNKVALTAIAGTALIAGGAVASAMYFNNR